MQPTPPDTHSVPGTAERGHGRLVKNWLRNGKSLLKTFISSFSATFGATFIHPLKLYFTQTVRGIGSTQKVGGGGEGEVGAARNQTEGKISGVKDGIWNFWLRFLVRGTRKMLSHVEGGGGGWKAARMS